MSNSFFQLHLLLFIIATVYLSTNAVSTFERLEVTVKRDRENLNDLRVNDCFFVANECNFTKLLAFSRK